MKRSVMGIIIVTILVSINSVFAAQPQTLKDSMNGNWAVINGKKIFLSGMNIAWITSNTFGNDIGDTKVNISAFTNHVKNIRKAGGNALRWWLHTDASHCPKIDSATGAVTGLGSMTISNMRAALDTAYAYGVVVSMCLFSFDLLVPGSGTGKVAYSDYNLEANYKFLTVASNMDTYLTKALKPILDSVGNHPAVMCWEVFNEPEGMLASANWSNVTKKITTNDILRITNKIAGFVHRNSKKMVSTGIASFQYVGEYSKAKLIAAGGDSDGYLDFYMAHYYPEWQDATLSPFEHPSTFWNMDRPILAGEFPAKSWSASMTGPSSGQPLKTTKTINDAFAYAYANGYAGAMSWALSEQASSFFGDYSTTAPALLALYTAHKNDIMIKDVVIQDMSGNYVMRLQLANLAVPSGSTGYFELGNSFSKSFTGKTNLYFDIFVQSGSATNLQIQPVIKVTSSYTWSPATSNALNLNSIEPGKWVTISVPVTAFGASDVSDVRELLFQYWALNSTYAAGTIYFDNIRIDGDTLAHFNTEGSAWFTGASAATVALVKYADVSAGIKTAFSGAVRASWRPDVSVRGKTVSVVLRQSTDTRITLLDLQGKSVAAIDCASLGAGRHSIQLKNVSAGPYIVEIRKAANTSASPIMIQ
jgi:hypothetical protein